MGFWLGGLRKVKKKDLQCPLVFSLGWMKEGAVSDITNPGFGEENGFSYKHTEFEEPAGHVGEDES